MTTYEMLGGGRISAETTEQVVKILNRNSLFGFRKYFHDFMLDTAKACKLQKGCEIRTQNTEVFVEDLLENEFLKIVD